MRHIYLSESEEEAIFALKAAKWFKANPGGNSFSLKGPTPGELLAIRWGAGDDGVVVVKLDYAHTPVNYMELVKTHGSDEDKHPATEIARLESENALLKRGMKGDYDLDAWLDWAAHKDTAVILLNHAENILAEDRLVSPGDTSVPNTQDDREELRKRIEDYLRALSCS